MDKVQADAHILKKKLQYKDINTSATSKAYCKHFNRGELPPVKNLLESKAPPTGYSANVAETKTWCRTQAKVLVIFQQVGVVKGHLERNRS